MWPGFSRNIELEILIGSHYWEKVLNLGYLWTWFSFLYKLSLCILLPSTLNWTEPRVFPYSWNPRSHYATWLWYVLWMWLRTVVPFMKSHSIFRLFQISELFKYKINICGELHYFQLVYFKLKFSKFNLKSEHASFFSEPTDNGPAWSDGGVEIPENRDSLLVTVSYQHDSTSDWIYLDVNQLGGIWL